MATPHDILLARADPDEPLRPPVLVLLHGYWADERAILPLARRFAGFSVVAPRAPVQVARGRYGWARAGFSAAGPSEDLDEMRGSLQALQDSVGGLGGGEGGVWAMGFSQGAAMALGLALSRPAVVAGVVAVAGRLVPGLALGAEGGADAAPAMLVLLAHGTRDRVVPVAAAHAARRELERLRVDLTYREYAMGHEIAGPCLSDAAEWLASQALNRRSR